MTQINLIQELFQALGLVINKNKSHMVPTQEIVFLGFHLSSIAMTISLPQEKIKKIKQEAACLLKKPLVSIQHLATFVGMTTAARQAIPVAPLFHHQLQALMLYCSTALLSGMVSQAQSEEAVQQAYHQEIALSVEARTKLEWWVQEAATHNQSPVTPPVPNMII